MKLVTSIDLVSLLSLLPLLVLVPKSSNPVNFPAIKIKFLSEVLLICGVQFGLQPRVHHFLILFYKSIINHLKLAESIILLPSVLLLASFAILFLLSFVIIVFICLFHQIILNFKNFYFSTLTFYSWS